MTSAAEWPPHGFLFPEVDGLPELDGSRMRHSPVLLVVEQELFHLEEDRLSDGDQLREALDDTMERLRTEQRLLDSDDPIALAISVQSTVSGSRLSESLELVEESNFDFVYFIFAAPPAQREFEAIPEDIVERVTPHISRPTPENRQQMLASNESWESELEGLAQDCPALVDYQDSLETVAADERGPFVREQMPEAWLDCKCGADIELLVAIHSRHPETHRNAEGYMHATAIEISVEEALEFLEDRDEQLWGDLAADFVSTTSPD